MFRTFFVKAAAAYAVVAGMAQFAPAGIITGFSLPSGPTVPVSTPVPNNDNTVAASPNVIDLPVAPGTALVFNNADPVDIVFSYQPSGATTEYFVRETILNNSAVDWSGLSIRFQSPFNGTALPLLPGFDGPNLDPPPTASAFAVFSTTSLKTWSSGVVPTGATLDLTFSIDVPNLDVMNPPPDLVFTLRQTPIAVPEPMTYAMLFAGTIVLALCRLLCAFQMRKLEVTGFD